MALSVGDALDPERLDFQEGVRGSSLWRFARNFYVDPSAGITQFRYWRSARLALSAGREGQPAPAGFDSRSGLFRYPERLITPMSGVVSSCSVSPVSAPE